MQTLMLPTMAMMRLNLPTGGAASNCANLVLVTHGELERRHLHIVLGSRKVSSDHFKLASLACFLDHFGTVTLKVRNQMLCT